MALIKCPECEKEISNKATACPHCGCPVRSEGSQQSAISTPTTSAQVLKQKKKHGCLTFIIILIFISFVVGSLINNETSATDKKTNAESLKLTKEDAQSVDSEIWNYVYPVITANNDLMTIMSGYSEGTVSELDLYNATTEFEKYAQQVWGNPPSVSDDGGKKYLDSCRDYVIIEQTMAQSLLKYINSKKTSDLSKLQEDIERCTQAVQVVASNRGTFLGINDFTDEEIKKIVEDTMQ